MNNINPTIERPSELQENVHSQSRIQTSRPLPSSTRVSMTGVIGSGTHGSVVVPLAQIEYLANAKPLSSRLRATIRMQPITNVTLDRIKLRLFAVFCPNNRVWSNAEFFSSQRLDGFKAPPATPPMTSRGSSFYFGSNHSNLPINDFSNSTVWRDSIAGAIYGTPIHNNRQFNALYHRSFCAIWNDIFRDKTYQPALVEFKDDVVTETERNLIFRGGQVTSALFFPEGGNDSAFTLPPAPAMSSYFNNYRNYVNRMDNTSIPTNSLQQHQYTQQLIDEYRNQAENANKTDAEIVAMIRGGQIAKETECFIIGERSIDIDLALQPQTSDSETLSLGADGAISYTFADLTMHHNFSSPKDGIIHYVYMVVGQSTAHWSSGQVLEHVKQQWHEFYRPSLAKIKDAPFYNYETQGDTVQNQATGVIGWKRRYSEYTRMATFVRGDFIDISGTIVDNKTRTNPRGFNISVASGGVPTSLPSNSHWALLSSNVKQDNTFTSYASNKTDTLCFLLRYLLVNSKPGLSYRLFRHQTQQTFYLYGTLTLDIEQPILPEIMDNYVAFGDE